MREESDYNSTCVKTAAEAKGFEVGDCLYTPYYQFAWQLVGIIAISLWALGTYFSASPKIFPKIFLKIFPNIFLKIFPKYRDPITYRL